MDHTRLDDESSRLFIDSGKWNVESITLVHDGSSLSCKTERIADLEGLERSLLVVILRSLLYILLMRNFFKSSSAEELARVFIIRQQNSWGRFRISYEGFKAILKNCDTLPQFQDFVRAFGFKVRDSDEDFGGYDRHIDTSNKDEKSPNHKLCYIVRYVEKTDRHEPPWVFRHMAMYQGLTADRRNCRIILLQPPDAVVDDLVHLLSDAGLHGKAAYISLVFAINMIMLRNTESKWRTFINQLEAEYLVFNEKACFSRVGRTVRHDYSVAFDDTQELHLLRERLRRSLSSIQSSLETVQGIQSHFVDIANIHQLSNPRSFHVELECYQSRMRSHRRAVTRLLENSQGTFTLLLKMLDFRNDEIVHRNSAAMQSILLAAGTEAESTKIIAEKTQVDSRSMKIFTMIALLYLPASFVASIFSANVMPSFVHSAHGQIMSYLIITSVLTLLTLGVVFLLESDFIVYFKRIRIGGKADV